MKHKDPLGLVIVLGVLGFGFLLGVMVAAKIIEAIILRSGG